MNHQDLSVLAIAVVISCSGVIINLVRRGQALKIKFTRDDNSLLWFRILVPGVIVISLVLYFMRIGAMSLPVYTMYAGYLLVVSGLVIRWFAIISLGNAFTVKVSIIENHALKTDGIYSHIRHPSYTGLLLYYAGLGLVMENIICLLLLIIIPFLTVINRIGIEETVLLENFPAEYTKYRQHTRRLFPFLY